MADEVRWPTAVGAVAAALTATVALVAYLWPDQPNKPPTPHPPTPTSRGITSPPQSPPQSSTHPKSDVIRWRGRITITFPYGIQLDPIPPHPGTGSLDFDIGVSGGGEDRVSDDSPLNGLNIASWPGSSLPSRKECSIKIDTNGASDITVRAGDIVCVKTTAGRIAVLKLIRVRDNYEPDTADATVWELS